MTRIADLDEMRRRFLIGALGLGTLTLTGTKLFAAPIKRMPPGKSIFKLKGIVTVNGIKANPETIIFPGDTIITGEKSFIIFVVNTEAFILRSHSHMVLEKKEKEVKKRVLTTRLTGVTLTSGKLLSVFTPRNPLRITTPSAIVGIRGTGVYIESEPDLSYICTCYGTTNISVNGESSISEVVSSTHHSDPRYVYNKEGNKRIEPAPFKNHDDEELLLIETLVGRQTPFIVPGGSGRSRRKYY